ncbi:putative voltage-gated potassium channel subunit beta [Lachnellula cervina]|uniref:Putative voltage-gated potassium channel subunit beta n=1 Tax=Lachnellula cervina TaxID=1316786 RepID=A0A7D8YPM3_9HELO|nr:putative voltage-gated potassium channel subunit beta [Lachnellula cervina]
MAPPEGLPKMEYRFLGRSGLQVSAISLGGWLTYGGHVENENTFACMKAAYDVGINFFDCAEGYSGGESERVMGEAIKKFKWKRNDIVVSTKIYWGAANGENPVNNVGLSRKHIVEGVNASLERLGLDYVDLIYAHRPDRNTPIEETVRAFNHIIDTGKAFYWGTSEWNADEIATAWRVADKLGLSLGLTTFSPLKQGFLTGKYNDGIPSGSRLGSGSDDAFIKMMNKKVGSESWKEDIANVQKLKPIADKLGISQATLAYAWVLSNKNVSSAITGASRPEQVYESVKAFEAVKKLTPEVLKEIDDVLGNKPAVFTRRF